LRRQVGAVNFAPLKSQFLSIYQSSHSYLACGTLLPPLAFPIFRSHDEDRNRSPPYIAVTLQSVISKLENAYDLTRIGKFSEALSVFREILQMVLVTVVSKKSEQKEVIG